MYSLKTRLNDVRGIGPKLFADLNDAGITTVADLLLQLPLRYEDRSHFTTIAAIPEGELVTIQAKVEKTSQFSRNGRSMQTAEISDETGKLKLMWFNNKFILSNLKQGQEYLFSGKYNAKYRNMTQPQVEAVKADTIHTGRLVPLYSSKVPLAQGTVRRVLKNIIDHLDSFEDKIVELLSAESSMALPDFKTALSQLHFPDDVDSVAEARERLALEEFLAIMKTSENIKKEWHRQQNAAAIELAAGFPDLLPVPASIPFELTGAQKRSLKEILIELAEKVPMNRLLIGDVGSGKTVVAGIAAEQMMASGFAVAFIAPTKILAEQHAETLSLLFPDMPLTLITGKTKDFTISEEPRLYIGTHAVINKLPKIKPGLIVYDEQHRFGVMQRSEAQKLERTPHILTMTATPIPRSLMLTIFSHLSVSYIDELPKGRKPITTWVVPEKKRLSSYDWIAEQVEANQQQAIIVCPFIDPSDHEAFEKVAAATVQHQSVKEYFEKSAHNPVVALLHGRQKRAEQEDIIKRLYDQEIDILVTTPIVEVGIDLPKASIIIIESAERFGLASLHQLRGRVGRAGQESYCLLFTNASGGPTKDRLQKFTTITNGRELAELDLENRGSGEIFGTIQSGFSSLQFASWTNVSLIASAQAIYKLLPGGWRPLFAIQTQQQAEETPLAN